MPFNGVELPKQLTRTMDRNLQRLERMFDLDALQAGATELYRDHWCKRSDEPASKTWCHGFQRPALLYGNATEGKPKPKPSLTLPLRPTLPQP